MDFAVIGGNPNSALKARRSGYKGLAKRGLEKRSEFGITGEDAYYAATLKIGSRGDANVVAVDTGSSDLWVMSSDVSCGVSKRSFDENTPLAHNRRLFTDSQVPSPSEELEKRGSNTYTSRGTCVAGGSFNYTASVSYSANKSSSDFHILYGDGTYAGGLWGTDNISFGSVNISHCNFATAMVSTSDTGVFGIGLAADESSNSTYENLPMRFKSSGAINKIAYSLYLNNANGSSGSVLFGAVDHAKYNGQLQKVPIINADPSYSSTPADLQVVLNSITLKSSSQNITVSTTPIAALLDSGTSLTLLPSAISQAFAKSLGGFMTKSGFYKVSCAYKSSSLFAEFNFSGVKIKVPLSDLISTSITMESSCYLGIEEIPPTLSSDTPFAILGDNFLRNAYVVFDLEDYEISLAQVKFSDTEDIEVISSSVPSAVKAASYSSTSFATVATAIPTSTPSHLTAPTSSKSGSNAFYLPETLIFGVVSACFVFLF
ncbi:hypothetical protein JCM33374_g695 [Metschnikowia sp. JCM 33374]|nr:hypothetical protein JCM33374_g695 [Metschnikowia sp. JCM 33374]